MNINVYSEYNSEIYQLSDMKTSSSSNITKIYTIVTK